MMNDDKEIDNEKESPDVVLNDIENPDSDDFSTESSGAVAYECPICIEVKTDMFALICGHTVCSECKVLLIQHNQLNICPLCRIPLNWNDVLQVYEDSDDIHARGHVTGEIVEVDIPRLNNGRVHRENHNVDAGDARIDRQRRREALYNICATVVGIFFVIMFWITIMRS